MVICQSYQVSKVSDHIACYNVANFTCSILFNYTTKMSADEVFQEFFAKLANSLPMDDVLFVAVLFSSGLLPGNYYNEVDSQPTRAHKAVYFLNHVIKPPITIGDDRSFNKLLNIMEDSKYWNVKELAQQIKSELKINADNITG